MQPTTLIILAVGLLTGQSQAASCTNNILYCGSKLIDKMGWSKSDVAAAVE
jgi:hypothetical protein